MAQASLENTMSTLSALAAAEAVLLRAEAEGFDRTVEALKPIVEDLRFTVETQSPVRRPVEPPELRLVINS